MHARYLAVVGLLALAGPVVAAACAAPIESSGEGAGGANMTPSGEPIAEVQEPLPFCECSVASDWCKDGKHCKAGKIPCIRVGYSCGSTFLSPCDGWCVK
jgi:hypothetical protein